MKIFLLLSHLILFSLLIIGGVGKSAITNRFVVGRWINKYDPTVEESYQTTVDINGKALQVEILDTAGQDAYTSLRETFMHTGDGFLLVYSITDDQTFEELQSIRKQILRVHSDRDVPMMVVGNKVDLANDRAVSQEEGQNMAKAIGAEFMEVTAKEDFKVKDAFHNLIKMVLTKNPSAGQESGTGGVFGAGIVDHSGDVEVEVSKTSKKDKSSKKKKDKEDKEKKNKSGKVASGGATSDEASGKKCNIL
jgi:small GTP-binding protein